MCLQSRPNASLLGIEVQEVDGGLTSQVFYDAVLVGTANRADQHGGNLQVVCARPKIRQLLRLTGLDCRIPLARTLDEALAARAGLAARAATPANPPH